jgi:hypothetical protein
MFLSSVPAQATEPIMSEAVMGRVAEARKEQRNAKAENRDKPPPGRKKSNDSE